MRQRFLILCRAPSDATRILAEILASFGEVEVVSDSPAEEGIWYPDHEMSGFGFLNGFSDQHREFTAWERAWKHLDHTNGATLRDVWLIEDDVAGSPSAWSSLVNTTLSVAADLSAVDVRVRENDPYWGHWKNGQGLFCSQSASFNPVCRLSSRLVAVILEFRRCYQRFIFQEVLFASLTADHGFSYLDWSKYQLTKTLFESYAFRPEVTTLSEGICHPVKDLSIHMAICEKRA